MTSVRASAVTFLFHQEQFVLGVGVPYYLELDAEHHTGVLLEVGFTHEPSHRVSLRVRASAQSYLAEEKSPVQNLISEQKPSSSERVNISEQDSAQKASPLKRGLSLKEQIVLGIGGALVLVVVVLVWVVRSKKS